MSLNSDCRRREIKVGAALKRDGPPGPVLCGERPRSGPGCRSLVRIGAICLLPRFLLGVDST